MPLVIAIDGPAGAGKSTVARGLAERLGLNYVDSGATYRAAALKVLEDGVCPDDSAGVISAMCSANIQLHLQGTGFRVMLNGRDVSDLIRSPEVALAAAKVSRLPEVRSKLIALQRSFACDRGLVMEGRDIGTVVFAQAPLKIFLTARSEERARRRLHDERQQGWAATLQQTAKDLARRDQLDSERKLSPLVPASDARMVDSTGLTAEQVVEKILQLARERNLIG